MTFDAIVFDLGGVLVDVRYERAVAALAARSDIAPEALARTVYASPLFLELESGACDARRFFGEMRSHARLDIEFDEFCAIYCDLFAPVHEMIDVHRRMRDEGYRTYLFSNTSPLHFEYIRREYAFMTQFAGYFLSYELRCMKPDARAYEAVEARTGCRGERILYIDDRADNVETGARRGWHAIRHTTPSGTIAALTSVGLT